MRSRFSLKDARAVQALSSRKTPLGRRVHSALTILEEAVSRYGDGLACSFNGGKDATVLLHLYAAAMLLLSHKDSKAMTVDTNSNEQEADLSKPGPSSTSISTPLSNGISLQTPQSGLPCIYVQCQSPFPQVEEFVEECEERYQLDLTTINAPMKRALSEYKEQKEAQGQRVEAVLVGTRVGDPYADKLKTFIETDNGWPQLMRVHPILDWTYGDIWLFLRCTDLGEGGVGWCNLYDYGYTSLGSTFNTIPNPRLRDSSRPTGWKPAWELDDPSTERAGRPPGPIAAEVARPLSKPFHQIGMVLSR